MKMRISDEDPKVGNSLERVRVLVIGLDGATFDLIAPWVNESKLPNLAKIMRNGVSADLHSTIPPITPTAWASFRTGKNPGKHGAFDFYKKKGDHYERSVMNSADIDGKAVWTLLSEAGKRVIVVNVPMTYPVDKVNGFMISGLLTPTNRPSTYPPYFQRILEKEVDDYKISMEEFWCGNIESWIKELYHIKEKRTELTLYLMQKYPWDFFMIVFMGTDWVQHALWKYMAPLHSSQVSKEAKKHGDAILQFYQGIDSTLGRLLERMNEDTVMVIMSDHGHGPLHKQVHINHWLKKLGLLAFKKEAKLNPLTIDFWLPKIGLTKEKLLNWLFKLRSNRLLKIILSFYEKHKVEILFSDIDWGKTKAYAYGHMGQIFINLKGRESDGIVEPGEEYEDLRMYITKKLYELEDPETKAKIVDKVFKKEELYSGPHVDEAADLVFTTKEGYVAYNGFELDRDSIISLSGSIQSSVHTLNGILIVTGKGVKKGIKIRNATIIDLVPTILHIMSVPIPADIDGRVLKEIFETESSFAKREVRYQSLAEEKEKRHVWSEEEEEELKKRLRKLGYMG